MPKDPDHISTGQPESWKSFLPADAILMGRRVDPAVSEQPGEEVAPSIVYLTQAETWSAAAEELFKKMLGSIQLDPAQVERVHGESSLDSDRPHTLVLASWTEPGVIHLPDPEAVLADPSLKRVAWESLKQLKQKWENLQ
jgi:hypothetical protein